MLFILTVLFLVIVWIGARLLYRAFKHAGYYHGDEKLWSPRSGRHRH